MPSVAQVSACEFLTFDELAKVKRTQAEACATENLPRGARLRSNTISGSANRQNETFGTIRIDLLAQVFARGL
jgi:hypothetical protein